MADLILLLMIARIHWLISVLSIIVSGLIGAYLVKRQGTVVSKRLRSSLGEGSVPTEPLMDGGMVLLAAGLLLTPGLITDLFGISFLIPFCRRWYRARIKAWFKRKVQLKTFGFETMPGQSTVEGDFVRKGELDQGEFNQRAGADLTMNDLSDDHETLVDDR